MLNQNSQAQLVVLRFAEAERVGALDEMFGLLAPDVVYLNQAGVIHGRRAVMNALSDNRRFLHHRKQFGAFVQVHHCLEEAPQFELVRREHEVIHQQRRLQADPHADAPTSFFGRLAHALGAPRGGEAPAGGPVSKAPQWHSVVTERISYGKTQLVEGALMGNARPDTFLGQPRLRGDGESILGDDGDLAEMVAGGAEPPRPTPQVYRSLFDVYGYDGHGFAQFERDGYISRDTRYGFRYVRVKQTVVVSSDGLIRFIIMAKLM